MDNDTSEYSSFYNDDNNDQQQEERLQKKENEEGSSGGTSGSGNNINNKPKPLITIPTPRHFLQIVFPVAKSIPKSQINDSSITQNLHSVLLLFIGLTSNLLAGMLPCRVREMGTDTVWFQHMLLFGIILFTIVSTDDSSKNKHGSIFTIVSDKLFRTVMVWLFFVMMMRQSLRTFGLIILLAIGWVTISRWREEHVNDLRDPDAPSRLLEKVNAEQAQHVIEWLFVIVFILGNIHWIYKNNIQSVKQYLTPEPDC